MKKKKKKPMEMTIKNNYITIDSFITLIYIE